MRVAVLDDYQHVARSLAAWDRLHDTDVVCFGDHVIDPDELVARLTGYEVVVAIRERTPFPRATLERLRDLRLLITTGPYNASIDVDTARELGITVCGTGGPFFNTAELTWALILAVARHVPAEDALLRAGGWQRDVGRSLHGATLSVLGLGHLGGHVARIGLAFGMTVVAWSTNLAEERCAALGVTRVERDELFERADVLTIHLRLSDRTVGLVGAHELRGSAPRPCS